MKNYLSFLFVFVIATVTFGATEETLFCDNISHGGYGGPTVKLTKINGSDEVLVGGQGGWIINHSFIIGGGGYGLTTHYPVTPDADATDTTTPYCLNMGYGGLLLHYIVNPMNVWHLDLNALVGAGGLSYRDEEWENDWDEEWESDEHDGFFVFEPGLNIELNVTSFFRIAAGVSYRYTNGANFLGLDDKALSGAACQLMFKFGKF